MKPVEILLFVVFIVAVLALTDRFFGSVVREKGTQIWRKFADWIRDIVTVWT